MHARSLMSAVLFSAVAAVATAQVAAAQGGGAVGGGGGGGGGGDFGGGASAFGGGGFGGADSVDFGGKSFGDLEPGDAVSVNGRGHTVIGRGGETALNHAYSIPRTEFDDVGDATELEAHNAFSNRLHRYSFGTKALKDVRPGDDVWIDGERHRHVRRIMTPTAVVDHHEHPEHRRRHKPFLWLKPNEPNDGYDCWLYGRHHERPDEPITTNCR